MKYNLYSIQYNMKYSLCSSKVNEFLPFSMRFSVTFIRMKSNTMSEVQFTVEKLVMLVTQFAL